MSGNREPLEHCTRLGMSNRVATANVTKKRPQRTSRPVCAPDKPSCASLERILQRRRWHHADCMAPMPISAAIAFWHAGADGVAHECVVADALRAERTDLALALLHATTPLVLAGAPRDTCNDAAVDAARVCRRLALQFSLVSKPSLVWETICAWEGDAGSPQACSRAHDQRSARDNNTNANGDVANAPSIGGRRGTGPCDQRATWRFLLRFRFAAFVGSAARVSAPDEVCRVWQAASSTMRAHILALAIKHGNETLRLAERPDCQRMWATVVRATTARPRSGRPAKACAMPGLLASMRGAVASARNAALWAIALRIDPDRKRLSRVASLSRGSNALSEKKKRS